MAMGGIGCISVLSNVLPAETRQICNLWFEGKVAEAAALQMKYKPLIDALFSEVNPIPVKAAMKYIGYDCGNCRMPLTPVSAELAKKLKAILT